MTEYYRTDSDRRHALAFNAMSAAMPSGVFVPLSDPSADDGGRSVRIWANRAGRRT